MISKESLRALYVGNPNWRDVITQARVAISLKERLDVIEADNDRLRAEIARLNRALDMR